MSVPTDFDFVNPCIGLRKLIENPQLRSPGNNKHIVEKVKVLLICRVGPEHRSVFGKLCSVFRLFKPVFGSDRVQIRTPV